MFDSARGCLLLILTKSSFHGNSWGRRLPGRSRLRSEWKVRLDKACGGNSFEKFWRVTEEWTCSRGTDQRTSWSLFLLFGFCLFVCLCFKVREIRACTNMVGKAAGGERYDVGERGTFRGQVVWYLWYKETVYQLIRMMGRPLFLISRGSLWLVCWFVGIKVTVFVYEAVCFLCGVWSGVIRWHGMEMGIRR